MSILKLTNLITYDEHTFPEGTVIPQQVLKTNIKAKSGYNYIITDTGGNTSVYAPRFQGIDNDGYILIMFMGGTTAFPSKSVTIVGIHKDI